MWKTLKRWYHQLGSPRYFYRFCEAVLPWLVPVSLALLAVGLVWGLVSHAAGKRWLSGPACPRQALTAAVCMSHPVPGTR